MKSYGVCSGLPRPVLLILEDQTEEERRSEQRAYCSDQAATRVCVFPIMLVTMRGC